MKTTNGVPRDYQFSNQVMILKFIYLPSLRDAFVSIPFFFLASKYIYKGS